MRVDEHTIELDSAPAFYRSADASGVPTLYLHGVPTSSDDWIAPLERTGGLAMDLIGFGRSTKAGDLDYSIGGLADYVQRLLGWLGIERIALVAHDWGSPVALELALRAPDRIGRLALINPPALIEGFPWPRHARWWKAPGVGELMMGATTRSVLNRALRRASATPNAWPEERLTAVWEQFDQGTQRAILRLHRHTDPLWVSARADQLGRIAIPVLLMGGDRDPWVPEGLVDAYAETLGGRAETVTGAGHWPWLDRPESIDTLQAFLESKR